MSYWFIDKSVPVWGESSVDKIYPSTYTFPLIYGGIKYDNENRLNSVRFKRVQSGSYAGRNASVYANPTPTTSVKIIQGGARPSVTPYNYKGMARLFISDTDLRTIDTFLTPLPTTQISGRFRFKTTVLERYGDTLAGSCYPLTVSINGVVYNYITFTGNQVWVSDATIDANLPLQGSSIAVFNNYGNVGTTPSDYTLLTKSLTSAQLQESYYNMIWDFGNIPQETTTVFTEWLLSVADPIYPYSYTVKNYSGDMVLSSIIESPSMVKADLVVVGNQKTLTLTGSNGRTYTMQWESETPEGMQFLGLSASPNSNRPTLLANTETAVSWTGDLIFYESYGKYRPPTTVFDINLYQNTAEPNRVDKGTYLTGVGTLSGALREECSIITPSIVYQSSTVPTFNYVYIPIFNRYYFVTSLSSVGKNLWRMELNCDVLMTYKQQIILLQGVIGRQERDFNPLLVDNELPTQNNPIVEVIDIPSDAFNTQTSDAGHNYVITVIGA